MKQEYISTLNIIVSGIMGIMGSFITAPFTIWFAAIMRRQEIVLEYKLREATRKKELLLAHELEKERIILKSKLQRDIPQEST